MKLSKKKKQKLFDTILLVMSPIVASGSALFFKVNFLVSILLFYAVPSIYFALKIPKKVPKLLLFSLILCLPLGVMIDYVATVSGSWYVPFSYYRILNIVPVEDIIWAFCNCINVLVFYEYFFDKGKDELVNKRLKNLLKILIFGGITFLLILLFSSFTLRIPYAYFWLGMLFFFLPCIIFLTFYPKLLGKFVKTGAYFFVIGLVFELIGLHLNHWIFPDSTFVGWVQLFHFRFPFEEFFIYFVMVASTYLTYYEYFDDDRR